MVNTATSNEQHHHHHHEHEHVEQQQQHLHQPEPLNDPSGILSNSPNFASVNGIQIFEPIYQPNIAEKNLKVASVTLPNGHKRDFHIHKNSKGNVLFDLAAESETLLEKDYFGLRYEDELGEMTWLYPDKRIQKQLKHKPWHFVFQIKFYPPEPSALADDLTRYLLYLQIRKEIYEGKLPASYAKQILLAAMVMQAEIGDFEAIKQSPNDYEHFLREQHLIPQIDEEVLTKVREAHKEQKGLTPNEAHQKYLDTAKDLAKYGFTFYNAKDTKNGPVIIGIYAHGICVYKDQLQIHRFLWQGVNKIQFRGSKFSVVLKPGELDPKKEVTVNYRLADYATAKKLYRTAVEHHTFFRLIKPEDKPKGTFLRRWGSDRFRYQGRTYFQAKMASQMFDHPSQVVTIQRTPSGRQVSRSVDDLAQPRSFPTSPMHYVDETTQQLTTPEKSKSYSLSTSKADKAKKKAEELSPLSVVVHDLQQQQQSQKQQQVKSKRNSMSSSESSSSPCSVSMASPNSGEYYVRSSYTPQEKSTVSPYEEVIFPLSISKEERQQQYQTPIQRSSTNRNSRVRFSSDTKPVTPDDGSAVAMAPANRPGKRKAKRRLFGPVNDDHTAFSPVDDLYKAPEIASVPLDSRVTLYDKGWYTAPSTATRALSPTNFFVGCCKPPRRTLVSERLLRNRQSLPSSSEYSTIKRSEIEPHPIRYFVEVYHSGKPQIETKRKRRFMPRKDVDFVNPNELNRDYYNFPKDVCYDWDRTECSRDPEGLPLKQFSTIYWFGGNSKQGNAKPVGIKGQNIIVSSDVQQQQEEGERIIITEASTSQQSATTGEEEPRVVEIIEEKPVITVRQEEGKTITTIETTTVITTTEQSLEGGISEVVKEEVPPVQSSTPLPIETAQDVTPLPLTEPQQIAVIESFSKSEELDTVPIKKYSNVYHSGTSLENASPLEWVKKKRGIMFIKKSSLTKSQTSSASTAEEPQPSTSKETTPESLLGKRKKSTSAEPIVAKIAHEVSERARTFSMSKHYPEVSKPFEGQLKEIHRNPEAPSANLFDCVTFADEDTNEPKTKKAKQSRAARFCLACVGGNRQRGIERKASKESVQDPRLTTESGIHVEEVYAYEPTNVTEVYETVEAVTKTEQKKYDKIPEVIVTHDLSLIPATSDEELDQPSPLQSDVQHSDLTQNVVIIPTETSNKDFEDETKTFASVTIPPTPTPSEATFVEEFIHETVVKEQTPPKSTVSQGYPISTEEYAGEVDTLNRNYEAPHQELEIENLPNYPQVDHTETHWTTTDSHNEKIFTTKEQAASSSFEPERVIDTFIQETQMPTTTISKKTKMFAEKKHYPLIGTIYEGETSELQRQEDFTESNLFDTISFISDSNDSGLGADSGAKRKSGGLICIPKSKKTKKSKNSEIEKINYTEVQANRNKKVKRARLFSFSKNYPEIGGEIYQGQTAELKPANEAHFTNLFDEINFAPDEKFVEQVIVTKEQPKSTGLWCIPTSKAQKRTTSVASMASIKSEESIKNKTIEKSETYSMSKYYPEVGLKYEGEMSEISPLKDASQINIFDAINFLPKEEKIEVVKIETVKSETEQPQEITKEKSKSTGLWCVPTSKKQKRTTSLTSEESIKKGTLNALQIARNKAVERARTFSMSHHYPEFGTVYEGELIELNPVKEAQFTNLFDEINFAPDEHSIKVKTVEQKQIKPKKEANLLCMKKSKRKDSETSSVSSLSLKDHKNLNAMQTARNKIVRRARYFSTSKHYPEIGDGSALESELNELKPVQQAQFTNLFDEISFASDEFETKNIEKSKKVKAKKHKKSNLLCASKSKRKTSECSNSASRGTSVSSLSLKDHKNLNAMQIARNKLVQRARYFSTSKHYPEIGNEILDSELVELAPIKEAQFTKLFDEISFASDEKDEIKEVVPTKVSKKSKGLPKCLACTSFKSKPKEVTEEADEFAYERHAAPQDIVVEEHITVPSEEALVEYVEEPIIQIIEEPVVKASEDSSIQVVEELNVSKHFTQEIQEEVCNEEFVEIGLPIRNVNEAKEYTETTINVTPAKVMVETTFDEPERIIEIVQPPTAVEITNKESTEYSEGYPKISEPFVGDVSQLNYQQQVSETVYTKEEQQPNIILESTNPNLLVIHHEQLQKSAETIQQEEQWLIGYPQSVEQQIKSEHDELIHSEMAFKSQTYPSTSVKTEEYAKSSKTKKMFSLPWAKKKPLEGYPLYTEVFDKDVLELKREPEAPEKNLFDTISFQSDSEDSGLGADSGIYTKKKGLICIPKSKKTKKSKTSETEKINYTEVQANRNKKVKRARLFSFSKNYPEIGGEIFESQMVELKPAKEAHFTNLFDEISFAPDQKSIDINQDILATEKRKSTKLWCIPTSKAQKRTTSVASFTSIKSEESIKNKTIEKSETYSMSKYYPEVGVKYEGELYKMSPLKDASQINIIDAINFLPKEEEKIEIVKTETVKSETEHPQTVTKEKSKSSGLWCVPSSKKQKPKTSVDSIKFEESMKNKEIEKSETYSMSKYYPEVGFAYEGEMSEISPLKDASQINIFDAINFLPKEEKIEVVKIETERPQIITKEDSKSKRSLWCGPGSQKRKTSSVSSKSGDSIKRGTLNTIQTARNRIVQKARTFSMSENYPNQEEIFEGELSELSPVAQAPSANLFDCVSFDDEPPAVIFTLESMATLNKEVLPRERPNYLLACLTCGTRKFTSPHYPAISEAYRGEVLPLEKSNEMQKNEISEFVLLPIKDVEEQQNEVTSEKIKQAIPVTKERIEIQESAYSEYPVITEPFTGQLNTIYPQQNIDLANLNEFVTFENGSEQLNDRLEPVKTVVTETTETTWTVQEANPVKSDFDVSLNERLSTEEISMQPVSEKHVETFAGLPEVIVTEVSDLTLQSEIPKSDITEHIAFSDSGEGSHRRVSQVVAAQKHIIISDEAPEMISAVTIMDEPTVIVELTPAQEMPSKNLFDTISFESESDDSGLGADAGANRKSGGLICIPKSKKTKKSKTSEIEKINYTEVQANRNKKVKRARLFSFSKNYPEIGGEIFEGEMIQLKPVNQIPHVNLFDEINFAPDEQIAEKVIVTKEKPKSTGLWCVPTSKTQKRTTSISSIKSEESMKNTVIKESETYSMSKYYPEVGVKYEGGISKISPIKDTSQINIFDAINFLPKEEKIEVIKTERLHIITNEKSKSKRSLWCGPGSQKRKTSSVSSKSGDSIKRGTLNTIQTARNRIVQKAQTFSMSENYPNQEEIFEGELAELKPIEQAQFTNLFDEINFEPDEEETVYKKKQQIKPIKLRGPGIRLLWCAPKHHDYSSYPNDTKPYTGELKELKVVEEAPSANLFDCVSFASTDDVNQDLLLNGHVVSQPTLFEHQQPIIIEQESITVPYGYPLPTEIYEGEYGSLEPQRDYDHINIYERIEQVPKGISYVPPPRKPSFLDKIRRASFREASNENISFEREIIREEVQHVQKSEPMSIPTIVEPEPVVILEKHEDTSEMPVTENVYIVEEPSEIKEAFCEQTMEIELSKSGDISYHNETTIIPDVFVSEAIESETIPEILEELKNYPVITEPFTGELSVLNKKPDAPSSDLFEEINFLIVEKSAEQPQSVATKSTKQHKFLWCGGQRSESPETAKIEKTKTFRNRVRTFSMSKHYPETAAPFEGEILQLKPSTETQSRNLFDEISFASAESRKEINKGQKPKAKKRGLWCVPTSKTQKRTTSVASIISEESMKNKVIEKSETYSLSKYYPEVGLKYEGEISEISPLKDASQINIFDAINFHPKEEKIEVVKTKTVKTEIEHSQEIAKEKSKSTGLWCVPTSKKQKRTTSVTSEESIKKGTLNALQIARNKAVERARTFSMSHHYPEFGTVYEGELVELNPVKQIASVNLFDEINFAPDGQSIEVKTAEQKQIKPKKDSNLLCMKKSKRKDSETSSVSSLSLKDHKNLNAMQTARNKIVRRARYFSTSKHYPEIGGGSALESEMIDLKPVQQAQFTNLFDEISFASDEFEIKNIEESKKVKAKKHKKSNLLCATKSKRKTSESSNSTSSGTSVSSLSLKDHKNLNAMQIARNKLVQRARYFSTSKHYPEIGNEMHESELVELAPIKEAQFTKLFDEISFASDDKDEIKEAKATTEKLPSKSFVACLNCAGRKTPKAAGEPYEIESIEAVKSLDAPSSADFENASTLVVIEKDLALQKSPESSASYGYPLITEPFTGEISALNLNPEIEYSNLPVFERKEEIVVENIPEEFSDEIKTDENIISEESQWISGMPEVIQTERHHEIITTQHVTSESTTFTEQFEQQDLPVKSLTSFEQVLSDYPQLTAAYESEVETLTKVHEVAPVEFERYEESTFESTVINEIPVEITEEESIYKREYEMSTSFVEEHPIIASTEYKDEQKPTISKRTKMLAEKKHYPLIGTIYDGETSELRRQEDFKESNLFDTISFISDSDDSGLGADSGAKRKSGGLICIPKSKKTKKSKTSEIKKINYTEVQANRNKKVKRARLFSFSKNYPEIGGEIFEGETTELKPVKEAQFTNLFDEINFAPDEQFVRQVAKEKPKHTGLWCVPTSKTQKRTTSVASMASIKSEESMKVIEKSETYSMSKYYPEIGLKYEGELYKMSPLKDASQINIFDAINFLPKEEEKIEVVKTKTVKTEIEHSQEIAKEKSKSTGLWCVPTSKKQKRTTSVTSEDSIKKGTLNALQIARNKAVERARTFSMSHHYPEFGTVYEGELVELNPVKQIASVNLFDEVDFASDDDDVIVKKKAIASTAHQRGDKTVFCAPFKTSSKRYPQLEEPYTGTVHETNIKKEVQSADLFKSINFEASNEQAKEEDDKVGRMQSEERQPRKQMATLYFRRNTKQLEGYPLISEAYGGTVTDLLRHPDLETINLFDCVSFASESDDEIPISQSSNAKDSSKKGSPDKPKKKQLRLFGKTRRSTSDKELDLTSYPKSEEYSGPLKEIIKGEEMNRENLRKYITIYHSGYSQPLLRHRFIREKHEGIEEIGDAPADYEISHFTAEETTPMAPMPELEALPLRSYAKYPIVSISESPRDMKRKFSKSKIIPESSSESSSQSESEADTVPSLKPSKKKESEGFLSFFRNRLSAKQQQRKRTGYEGLVEAFSGTYNTIPKSNEVSDKPILEHVLVYHNGNSSQQPIDSGFEDGANASETERAGTFKRTGKLFFDKFKLSRDSGDKTTTEEIDKSESLEPKKVITTGYENLNIEPFLGLHSSTIYSADFEQQPLTSAIDTLPAVYFYEGDATFTPIPVETTVETKVSTLERIIKAKKPRKDSNFAYDFLSVEGPIVDAEKKGEINDLPIGEHVTVYHCGRSDVPTAEVPPEVYVYEKEPISESLQSLTTAQIGEPSESQIEHVTHVKKTTKRESLKRYPEQFTYEGPIESLERFTEAENQHLNEYVNIYHSGLSTSGKKIQLVKQESKTEKQQPRTIRYSIDTTPYEGKIEETSVKQELTHLPLGEHASTYHPGKSEVQVLEDLEEREIQIRELSLIQRLMAMFKKRELQGYPSTSDGYSGPLKEINRTEDIKKSEIKNVTNVYHSGYSYDPKTTKLTLRRFAPKRRFRFNVNDYPKDSAPMDAVIYDLHATEDIPKTPSPVTLPPESLIFQSPKEKQPSRWYRFWFLRRRGEPQNSGLEPSMPIIVESMSHRITDTSASIIMATTDRSLFSKGHWPVTDIDVDVMLKTITKCQCECEALIIEKSFETGIGGSIQLQQEIQKQTLNDTSFRMDDNNCIMQTSNGTWLAKVTKRISTQMEQKIKADNIETEKAEQIVVEKEGEEGKNEVNDEVLLPQPSVVKEENVEDEDEIEVSRNSEPYCKWDSEPPYLWSTEIYENLEELIDDDDDIISKEFGELPLTHEKKDIEIEKSSVCDSEMFASIRRRLSEKLAKKEKKKEEKRLKKEEKERKKHAGKSGATASAASHGASSTGGYASESSSSSASVSDAEIEERHVVINKAIEGPVQSLKRGQELGDLDNIEEDIDNNNKKLVKMAPQTSMGASAVNNIEANSSGPYTPAKEKDGRIIREETVEQVYRISGTGHAPNLDPNDMSLQSTVDKCIRDTERMPRVQMVEANVLVKECEPLPHGISEGSAPHTTLHSWHETEDGPETITTEVDEHGNKITRTVKTQTTKHTIQKQTYQTYAVEDKDKPDQTIIQTKESTIPLGNKSVTRSPVVHTKTRTVAYEKGSEPHENIDPIGELVSTKTITTGNRTVEILTYKTEKDGVIETRVEHRVTIHSGDNIDHDAELAKALLEATEMSPDLIINRVEVEKQTQR